MIMSAVKTVAGALAYCGGHIIAVESIAPMLGPGRVSATENGSIYGTDDESVLYGQSGEYSVDICVHKISHITQNQEQHVL